MRVLILSYSLHPPSHHKRTINHHVDLLTVIPALGILIAIALDPDMFIHDHELDVAGALLEFIVDGTDLVFRDVCVHS